MSIRPTPNAYPRPVLHAVPWPILTRPWDLSAQAPSANSAAVIAALAPAP